jgi:cytochrome c551/c552
MNKLRLGFGVTVFALLGGSAHAQDAAALAQAKGCTACHDVSQQKLGPSFHAIGSQYKGQQDAAAKLVDELKYGTGGHMKIAASDAELQQLVSYVLSTP